MLPNQKTKVGDWQVSFCRSLPFPMIEGGFMFARILLVCVLCGTCIADDAELKKDAERLDAAMKQYVKFLRANKTKVPKTPIPPLYLGSAKKGDIGLPAGNTGLSYEGNKYRVVQVIDDMNLLITTAEMFQPLRDGGSITTRAVTVWVSGITTEGITDGSSVQLSKVFEVKGTKQYGTAAGGSNTIMEIAPFSIQDEETLKRLLKEAEKKK